MSAARRQAGALDDLSEAVTALTRARLFIDSAMQRRRKGRAGHALDAGDRAVSEAHTATRFAEAAVLDAMKEIGS